MRTDQRGFTPATSETGRDLQRMLQGRPDIRALIGFAEQDLLERVLVALEDRTDFADALQRIAGDWRSAADQSAIAKEALARAAARRAR